MQLPVKLVRQTNAVLASSHDHIKIVTKLQNIGILQPRVPVPRREVSTTSRLENQQKLAEYDAGLLGCQMIPLKDQCTDLLADGLTILSFSARAAAQKAPGIYRKELNCLASKWKLEGQLAFRQRCWQTPFFLCWVLSPHSLQVQVSTKSESSSTWLILVTLP